MSIGEFMLIPAGHHPRNRMDDNDVILTEWVEPIEPKNPEQLEKLYKEAIADIKDLDKLDEFSKILSLSIDHYLRKDTNEGREVVKTIIDNSINYVINVYVGMQINTILRAEPKLISDSANIRYFDKYRNKVSDFNIADKVITKIKERFID